MIAVKKIVLSLCLILLGASVLSGCTKDEFLDQYNNIVQSAGSIALTGNSSLQGTKEKGIDDYTVLAPGTHSHFESGKFSQFWPEPGTNPAQWVRLKTPFRVHPKQPN